jgi:hypothetical protein
VADIPDAVRAACWARQQAMGGGCWHCGRPTPEGQRNLHHRLPGGPSVPSNLAGLWPGCHIHQIHGRPVTAKRPGWLISPYDRRPPCRIPVWVQGLGWVLLDDQCGWAPVIGAAGHVAPPPGCVTDPRSLFAGMPPVGYPRRGAAVQG